MAVANPSVCTTRKSDPMLPSTPESPTGRYGLARFTPVSRAESKRVPVPGFPTEDAFLLAPFLPFLEAEGGEGEEVAASKSLR